MKKETQRLEFWMGAFGRCMPLLTAAGVILWAACRQSNVNGYVVAFFAALVVGALFAKDDRGYGEAIVSGLCKPMFGVIVLAVMLAAVSGKLISASGMVQTIAGYVEVYTRQIPEFSYRMKVKGGLTGYAQVYGKYNTTAYDKLKLDLMYIQNYSLLLDVQIIFKTVKILFMRESTEGFGAEDAAAVAGGEERGYDN